MSSVCILTDGTAQFTQNDFPGHERVYFAPFTIPPAALQTTDSRPEAGVPLIPPSPQTLLELYMRLSREFDAILVLTLSSQLSLVTANALTASQWFNQPTPIDVMDSRTTAVGLGWLVEAAAGAAAQGIALDEIIHRVRTLQPHLYMLFCIPQLTVLAEMGYLNRSQAVAGEILGMLPVFSLEDGHLAPLEKVHTQRHLLESFQEFLQEFDAPQRVALLLGNNQSAARTRPLREFVHGLFPGVMYSELPLPPVLVTMLGSQSIGLAVMDHV
jgi:DegV family protein with EDD domain